MCFRQSFLAPQPYYLVILKGSSQSKFYSIKYILVLKYHHKGML